MKPLAQEAVLLGLIRRLEAHDSWSGETHIKSRLICSPSFAMSISTSRFILYKYGPFSFELRDELTDMRAEGYLVNVAPDRRYGAMVRATPAGNQLEQRFPKTMARSGNSLDWISEIVGPRGVYEPRATRDRSRVTRAEPAR